MDIKAHIEELKETGITKLLNTYTKAQCDAFVQKCKKIGEQLVAAGKFDPNGDTVNIWNFFRHDLDLMPLVTNEPMDEILKTMMDEDYVLIGANIINRQRRIANARASGYSNCWHTDSRYLGGQRLAAGFSYQVFIPLDDFEKDNGATQYVPGTQSVRMRPDPNGDYPHEIVTAPAGTTIIVDSGVWHRGGPSGEKSRWGVFSMYGPWFMKPYFNYPAMMGDAFGKMLNPALRRLLHYTSQPPKDENERILTLTK